MVPTPHTAMQSFPPPGAFITADELFEMAGAGKHCELVKGTLVEMPPTGIEHGMVTSNLTVPVAQHVKQNKLGVTCAAETGFVIAREPDTVRAPDIAVILREKLERVGRTVKFFPEPPDLAVEVTSPGDTFFEVEEKVAEWLNAGVQIVWVVNPKRRTVTIHRSLTEAVTLSEADELDGGEVLPGFKLSVAEIFA